MIKIDWLHFIEDRCWFGWWYMKCWSSEDKTWFEEWQRMKVPGWATFRVIRWKYD